MLTEAIKRNDIIDLYIIMAMPEPGEEHNKYIANQVTQRSRQAIEGEIQDIVMHELAHGGSTGDVIKALYDVVSYYTERGLPESVKISLTNKLNNYSRLFFGQVINPQTFATGMMKTFEYFNGVSRTSRKEHTIQDLKNKSGLPWTMGVVKNFFDKGGWEDTGYGGKPWGNIANQANVLMQAGPGDYLKQLDRFVDFVHNAEEVIDKFKGYKEGWLRFILDVKQHTTNIKDLIPFASRDVQLLFKDPMWREMMHRVGGAGSDESDTAIINLFKKYAHVWEDDIDSDLYGIGFTRLASLVKEYGVNRVHSAINNSIKAGDKKVKALVDKLVNYVGEYEMMSHEPGKDMELINAIINEEPSGLTLPIGFPKLTTEDDRVASEYAEDILNLGLHAKIVDSDWVKAGEYDWKISVKDSVGRRWDILLGKNMTDKHAFKVLNKGKFMFRSPDGEIYKFTGGLFTLVMELLRFGFASTKSKINFKNIRSVMMNNY